MSAQSFQEAMRAKGTFFFAQGGRLRWFAPSPLAPGDVATAGALKAELMALVQDEALEALCAGLDPEEVATLREERAGILEHEGGLARLEAELRAGLVNAGLQAA